ncbi:hypothetical protein AAVH_15057 [Aphelenchoides avenae]|nr:hypothetical protein AAVH_15057 [Aphelenchus avenae]
MKHGTHYEEGAEFTLSHVRYRCSRGNGEVVGCRTSQNRALAVGEDVIDRILGRIGMVYRCYLSHGTVTYQEYPCGFQTTPPCIKEYWLPKSPYTPEELLAFRKSKKFTIPSFDVSIPSFPAPEEHKNPFPGIRPL